MEGIHPPQQLNLRAVDLSGEWRRWVRSFRDYLLAINLVAADQVSERRKLALFRHVGGEDVREIYSQMEFVGEDGDGNPVDLAEGQEGRTLEAVLERFQTYCNPRSGEVVSRFEFHGSSQSGESVDVYLMRLRRLAENCNFGDQRDSLIRDKLLFGLDNVKLRDRLITRERDEVLTLDYVIRAVRVEEASKALNPGPSEINSVSRNVSHKKQPRMNTSFDDSATKCPECGRNHEPRRCPAYNQNCNKCGMKGHWAAMCKSKASQANRVSEVVD
ncbi:uncharacterized protein [Watersipora subatra]|uniref:uncharacterized protein n=1 Tax=Watersipora subatra TaxID=2589382 RepID=UPI00355B9A1C